MKTTAMPARQSGFNLIEVLIAILIVAIGILGLAGLQARAVNAEFESYQRSQAILLMEDMVQRIRMGRSDKGAFKAISDSTTGANFLGTAGTGAYALDCSAPATRAQQDMCDWSDLLKGSAETQSGNQLGAMIGARGCIFYDATTELAGAPDTGLFTVAVSWQGTLDTVAPTVNCGNGLYGTETKRRTITMSFRFAKLD